MFHIQVSIRNEINEMKCNVLKSFRHFSLLKSERGRLLERVSLLESWRLLE